MYILKILLSNDDGIASPGIYALAKKFCYDNEVIICAPDSERSACSHSLTVFSPLRVKKHKFDIPVLAYSCNGTPADCVLFALTELMKDKPDLIISGINSGANLSQDVMYSGTVSAAFEGAASGVKSIAISLTMPNLATGFEPSADFLYEFINRYGIDIIENGTVLNINIPPKEIIGFKYCKLGEYPYDLGYEKRQDTAGRDYYWLRVVSTDNQRAKENTDVQLVKQGYVTITPLRYNLTDTDLLEKLKESE